MWVFIDDTKTLVDRMNTTSKMQCLLSCFVLLAVLFIAVELKIGVPSMLGTAIRKADAVNGATGVAFSGDKFRTFGGPHEFSYTTKIKARDDMIKEEEHILCKKWAVVTTIYEVSEAVRQIASLSAKSNSRKKDDLWCTVIVADEKTPKDYSHSLVQSLNVDESRIHFLSVYDQLNWADGQGTRKQGSKFVSTIPWKHFSRKNIGYLYAIQKGAQVVFDFDDDNILEPGYDPLPIHDIHHENTNTSDFMSMSILGWNIVRPDSTKNVQTKPLVANPFPLMGANVSGTSWPRGFPLDDINIPESAGTIFPENPLTWVPSSKIGVLLHIADKNPDIDAVHRLTKPLPISFSSSLMGKDYQCFFVNISDKSSTYPFVPYNAQSTIHTYSALWALLLPATVPGRVSDIWRAYFSERLFRDLDLVVGLVRPPSITQDRNEHNFLADMQAEEHLYYRTGVLVKFLDHWKMKNDWESTPSIPQMMEQLWIDLYERGYVEQNDIESAQLWLHALIEVGYVPGTNTITFP